MSMPAQCASQFIERPVRKLTFRMKVINRALLQTVSTYL